MIEKVGLVIDSEKEEIRKLFDRNLALNEIIPSLNSGLLSNEQKDELYEKVLIDMEKTNTSFQKWWIEKSIKYNWRSIENGEWHINFETNEIFLITN